MKKYLILFFISLILLTSCAKDKTSDDNSETSSYDITESGSLSDKSGSVEVKTDSSISETASESESKPIVTITEETSDCDFSATIECKDEADDSKLISSSEGTQQPIQYGQLTAGEWNDNDNWSYWNNLLNERAFDEYENYWQMNTLGRIRYSITFDQKPIEGVVITLEDNQSNIIWQSVTDYSGIAYLFNPSDIEEGTVLVNYKQQVLGEYAYNRNNVEFSYNYKIKGIEDNELVDIMFVIDTTGSMSDELEYLKEELQSVMSRVAMENNNLDINLSANYYRDDRDDYVIKDFKFTKSVDEVAQQMSKQYADGGGDYPEAVDEALYNAIYEHKWRSLESTKLLFLVLDAPPHHSDKILRDLNDTIKEAASQGIKIIPIASSGIDKETEILLRCMAIETNGTYVFLTNDSGIGNNHIEPTIGNYKVEYLNDLLVRLINKYTK